MPDFSLPAFNHITRLTARNLPFSEAMHSLIAFCRKRAPRSRIWPRVSSLDYPAALTSLSDFITRELQRAPADIRNLYVGIPEYGDDDPGLGLFLLGTAKRRTTPGRGTPAHKDPGREPWLRGPWWNENGPAWTHPTLTAIHQACIAETNEDTSMSAHYALPNAFAAFALRQLLADLTPDTWTRSHPSAAVATGFPGGDTVLVGIAKRST